MARARTLNLPAGTVIPADANLNGMWSPVYPWPILPIHTVLLPDGRVASWGSTEAGIKTGSIGYDVWEGIDPASGHQVIANAVNVDIYCSSMLLLPPSGNPSVFIAGGDTFDGTATTGNPNPNTTLLGLGDLSLGRGADLNLPRWYSSSIMLPTGEVYVQGGRGGEAYPEIRRTDGSMQALSSLNTAGFGEEYPRNFVVPDGRVFGIESEGGKYYYVDLQAMTLTQVGQLDAAYRGTDSSTAMFRPGRLLHVGGSGAATVVDVTGVSPVITPTGSVSTPRRDLMLTLLPNGKVLVTGGSAIHTNMTGVNYAAEIWDPQTGVWSVGANGAVPRLYHSTSLLLPDATVLVAGGGLPGPVTNLNAEIYYPPYLFTADGQEAPRPVISDAPTDFAIGKVLQVQVDSAQPIARVVMLKTGATTHAFNMDQRFIELPFSSSGGTLSVQAPTRANEATPGYYMLFVLDDQGVPSKAAFMSTGVASAPNPDITPRLTNPGNQTDQLGGAVDVALVASDPNGDTLRYSASGLPPGITLNTTTGRLSGAPEQVGTYDVVLGVADGVNAASAHLTWSITSTVPLELTPLTVPPPALQGMEVTFTATASGEGAVYQWDFGDGSPQTDWSAGGTASHAYTKAGVFFVTVTVADAHGAQQVNTILQAVYLPTSPTLPTASNTVYADNSALGAPRVWVVNQDNDSVSVLDGISGVRIAEIPVGSAPRSLAGTLDGRLWVTNKTDSSISVIDRTTLSVVATLTLPRGSQPHGIVASPTRNEVFVALEATGTVLVFASDTYAQTSSLRVGADLRHLALNGGGDTLWATRFITPPTAGDPDPGGKVVRINTSSMTVTNTVALKESTTPDSEDNGRGMPNYLGAPAVSPDTTQVWVPSKKDNIRRGLLSDGLPLNFQNTVRAMSARIVSDTNLEDLGARIDHDDASVASAALFDPLGVYLFVALETSREVAVVDAHGQREIFRFDVGRAPQGLAISPDRTRLYVNNYMDRTVSAFDLAPLLQAGQMQVENAGTFPAVAVDHLPVNVLRGKQLFYDARDTRLARDRYMSCASCHNDGGQDGQNWDLSSLGEGVRNTVSLRGKSAGQGFLHWSANGDEIQDFEAQIRNLAGGTGLMSDAAYFAGTRSQPLGDKKAGLSADLDALAAYVKSLSATTINPNRSTAGLSSVAARGKSLFLSKNCAACHSGNPFTGSGDFTVVNVGTIKPTSGNRLGGPLTGIDVPTLRDLWATRPYLHDGSASTLQQAIAAHTNISATPTERDALAQYLTELGPEDASAPQNAGTGTGLTGTYYATMDLSGAGVLSRMEAINFTWGTGAPAAGVPSDRFSVRWEGLVEAPSTGTYRFYTLADDGVRLWVNNVLLVDKWTTRGLTSDTSPNLNLVAGQKYPIKLEYFANTGSAQAQLKWRKPGDTSGNFPVVPRDRLFTN